MVLIQMREHDWFSMIERKRIEIDKQWFGSGLEPNRAAEIKEEARMFVAIDNRVEVCLAYIIDRDAMGCSRFCILQQFSDASLTCRPADGKPAYCSADLNILRRHLLNRHEQLLSLAVTTIVQNGR
ncbi:hypothetical protein LI87_0100925 [Stenotrophomonas maltophilia]|nr:hypothetical protein LI87_0100925 [Stenotrophomonas maltophilia]